MQDELDEKQLALEDTRSELEETKRQTVRLQASQPPPTSVGPPGSMPKEPKTSGFAVTGLVMGILSLLCFGPGFWHLGNRFFWHRAFTYSEKPRKPHRRRHGFSRVVPFDHRDSTMVGIVAVLVGGIYCVLGWADQGASIVPPKIRNCTGPEISERGRNDKEHGTCQNVKIKFNRSTGCA